MEALLKDEKGFALAIMTALLPLMVGAVLATFAVVSFIQIDLKLHHICRSQGLKGQEDVAPLLKSLLALNPLALKLKLELIQAKAQAVTGNPVALARLAQVEAKVLKLITQQQQLIRQSNILLLKAHASAQQKLGAEKYQTLQSIPLFRADLQVFFTKSPSLAVRPDSLDSPPTYSPVENFSSHQALEQRWQYRLSIIRPLQPFLTGNYVFEKNCAVTLKEENNKWFPQMKKDRFLSKSL